MWDGGDFWLKKKKKKSGAFARCWVSASTVHIRSFGVAGRQPTCVKLSLIQKAIVEYVSVGRSADRKTRRWRDKNDGPGRLSLNSIKSPMNIPSLSCCRVVIRMTVLCVSSSSLFLLLDFLPNSSFPKWSRVQRMSLCKCLTPALWRAVQAAALSPLCCSKCSLY